MVYKNKPVGKELDVFTDNPILSDFSIWSVDKHIMVIAKIVENSTKIGVKFTVEAAISVMSV